MQTAHIFCWIIKARFFHVSRITTGVDDHMAMDNTQLSFVKVNIDKLIRIIKNVNVEVIICSMLLYRIPQKTKRKSYLN